MWLIVGLGNPGPKYLANRHNVGFMALDYFVASLVGASAAAGGAAPRWKDERGALVFRAKIDAIEALFAKPQTFMNKSGEPTRDLVDFYKIDLKNLLVVHDDIDQPFGSMRVHVNRGHGGQNGVRSLHETLATSDYARLKLGIGRPTIPQMDVASYVLQNFDSTEQALLPEYLNAAGDAIECAVFEGFAQAATRFNKQIISKTPVARDAPHAGASLPPASGSGPAGGTSKS